MGQVTAVGEGQAKNRVAHICHRHQGCGICLCAGVWLNVNEVGAFEDLLCALNRKVFCDVNGFTTTVVATTRVAFRVLVRQHGSLRF